MANKVTITRKAVIRAILENPSTQDAILDQLGMENTDETQDALSAMLNKWNTALNKANKSTNANKNDDVIINDVVPFVVNADGPVTAKQVNDAIVHAERTNKASAMLRRAIELGLVSRDRVRKNANYVYAAPDYDWETYIAEYDAKVAEKAAARIAKARANRS